MAINAPANMVLVEYGVSMPRFSKKALDLAKEAADNHNAALKMHTHTEMTLDKDAFNTLTSWEANSRAEHRLRSVPFSDNGPRLIAAAGLFEYKKAMDALVDEGYALWADFLLRYDVAVQDARLLRGDRFDINDYPAVADLRKKFVIKFRILPMPSVNNLPPSIAAFVTNESQAAIDAAIVDAKRYVFTQLRKPVAHMHEKLIGYTGGRTGSFHGSLTENIVEILDLLPSLNIDNDPAIDAMAEAMRQALLTYTPDELREDDNIRAATAIAAEKIMSVMDSLI
jgi:hypothetical protein